MELMEALMLIGIKNIIPLTTVTAIHLLRVDKLITVGHMVHLKAVLPWGKHLLQLLTHFKKI